MRKIIAALILVFMMIIPTIASASDFTIEDAYAECCEIYPEFVETIKANGLTDEKIINFLTDIQTLLLADSEEITEDNFDGYFCEAMKTALNYRRNIAVRTALSEAYPAAAKEFADTGEVPEEFMPLYITMKNLIFVHGLIESEDAERAAVNFVSDSQACFFVAERARAIVAVYDAEGMLCSVESYVIEEDCEVEFAAAEGGKVKLMVVNDAFEPLCAAAEKNF